MQNDLLKVSTIDIQARNGETLVDDSPTIHPQHYASAAVRLEPIDLCRQYPFCFGNFVKYVLRAPYKGDAIGDYNKALTYLRWTLQDLEAAPDLELFIFANRYLAMLFKNHWIDMVYKANPSDLADSIKHVYVELTKYVEALTAKQRQEGVE